MSDDPDTCHLPNCDAPLVTATLCEWHARVLLDRPMKPPADVDRKAA